MSVEKKNLLYPELCYVLNGIFYKVHNDLGRFRNEKQYSDAIEALLKDKEIRYRREYHLPQSFRGEAKNRNIVDFLIEDKIVLEIKVKTAIMREDYFQILRYLSSFNCELGLIVNFRRRYLLPKRVLNSEHSGYSDTR